MDPYSLFSVEDTLLVFTHSSILGVAVMLSEKPLQPCITSKEGYTVVALRYNKMNVANGGVWGGLHNIR